MPGGVAREMRADDHRVLVLRSTASEAATRGKTRVGVKLAHVRGWWLPWPRQRLTRSHCRPPVGNIMGKLQLSVKQNALRCRTIQGMARPTQAV
jgi:hypothetical protein